MKLSAENERLHRQAVNFCREYRVLEWKIVEVLRKIDQTKLYLNFEVTSLFQYAVKCLNLPESTVYTLITVARKSAIIPNLESALREQKLSASKAARIVSVITEENSSALIDTESEISAPRKRKTSFNRLCGTEGDRFAGGFFEA